MTVAEALTLRAGFAKIKQQLNENGVDISDVKTVSDLPAVLSSILPAELLPQLTKDDTMKGILESGVLAGLLTLFANDAKMGALAKSLTLGSAFVHEEDLNG